jgi:hypothetical protein
VKFGSGSEGENILNAEATFENKFGNKFKGRKEWHIGLYGRNMKGIRN